MADTSHTGFPRPPVRMPYFAPAIGAMPLPGAGAIVEPQPAQMSATMPIPGDPDQPAAITPPMQAAQVEALPEVAVGFATAAISGAVTGVVAAGDARGAAAGAAVTLGLWSGFTALNGWRANGPRTRLLLVTGALAGLGSAAGLYFTRRR